MSELLPCRHESAHSSNIGPGLQTRIRLPVVFKENTPSTCGTTALPGTDVLEEKPAAFVLKKSSRSHRCAGDCIHLHDRYSRGGVVVTMDLCKCMTCSEVSEQKTPALGKGRHGSLVLWCHSVSGRVTDC